MKIIDSFIDVTKYAKKLPTSEYLDSGKYPIIDQGQKQIAGYTDIEEGLFTDVPAIIFGDHTRIIKYIDTPFFIGADGVKVIKSLDKGADYKYCYYLLKSARIPDTGYNRHYKWLKESVFPEHNKQQQKQIVDTLTAIDKLMCKYIAEINKLDELIKSRFVEMFGDFIVNTKGWNICKFSDIAIIDGNMTTDFEKYANYPHIGIDSIEKNTGELTGYRTVAEDNVVSGKYLFSPKHIIYSKIRPNLNKVALPNFYGVCSADAYPILPIDDKCNRTFLAYVMRSDYFLDYILQFCTRTNLPKVNRKEVSGFTTPLPPLDLQDQFSDFVAKVEQQKTTVQKSIDKLETLKKSLMQEYFG